VRVDWLMMACSRPGSRRVEPNPAIRRVTFTYRPPIAFNDSNRGEVKPFPPPPVCDAPAPVETLYPVAAVKLQRERPHRPIETQAPDTLP
jgi:hypothetical protein